MNHQKISQLVEVVCNMGCSTVKAIILTLESGHTFDGAKDLNAAEKKRLIKELKAIMSVYDYRD
ncbi:hypothetical protein MNBD_GAMMA09-3603 [hydrothermal vent metagenome]|uniref:Uncharacterized protein n=1 Tax=hydrothermal vent metagenome TaxID=652676 RepID=A0A3B0XKQ5_9ZZZZ